MKKIRCTIGTVSKALAEIERYRNELKNKTRIFMGRLAEIGIETAAVRFANAIYDGTNDVVVDKSPTWIDDNKLAISASGKSITFIEFGSGVHYAADSHPLAGEFGFSRGGYGHRLGRFDSWRYRGDPGTSGEIITEGKYAGMVRTHGNPANRAMYDTGKELREQIAQIAREVFGNN